jgi:hypothetical protein
VVLVAVVAGTAWVAGHASLTGGATVAAAETAPARSVVTASVDAAGTPVGAPSGWRAQHVDRGRYVLEFARPVELSLASWELPATVILRPITARAWQVDFVDGHRGIDTSFSFTALAAP